MFTTKVHLLPLDHKVCSNLKFDMKTNKDQSFYNEKPTKFEIRSHKLIKILIVYEHKIRLFLYHKTLEELVLVIYKPC